MADDGSVLKIIEAIARLETKMDAALQRLERGDQRFQMIEERIRELEKADQRLIGVFSVLTIIVTTAINIGIRLLMP